MSANCSLPSMPLNRKSKIKNRKFLAVLIALALFGCTEASKPPVKLDSKNPKSAMTEDHSHGEGPHGGCISDWGGGQFHVEFMVDHDKQEATVYILASDAKTAVPIKTEKLLLTIKEPSFQVDLVPTPLDGESVEKCSRFVGKHESLGKTQEFGGTISGEADGKPYAGDFQEEAHDHDHGHKHKH